MGRQLIIIGTVIVLSGLLWLALERFGIPKLPGDFVWKRGDTTVSFPLMTSIILSIILTVVLNLFFRR